MLTPNISTRLNTKKNGHDEQEVHIAEDTFAEEQDADSHDQPRQQPGEDAARIDPAAEDARQIGVSIIRS